MNPKWLYRLNVKDPNNGLWYNANAEFVCGIGKIKDRKTKYLPMDYDERYHKGPVQTEMIYLIDTNLKMQRDLLQMDLFSQCI